jgi:hypothetical protein
MRQPTNSIVEGTPELRIPYFKHHKNLRTRVIYGGLKSMVHKHKGIGGLKSFIRH